ncbi:MAG: Flp pilus assembly protein CpaB, partial [Pseudomonadota bacterium]
MRIIALIILLFGLALAGGATFFASQRYAEIENELRRMAAEATPVVAAPAMKTVPVVVATKALRYGEELDEEMVEIVEFPEQSAPDTRFTTLEDLFGDGRDARIVLRAMEPNEPILKTKVTGFGERATISAQLTPGMRAFTLRIDSVSGVAGFLLPNDRVDIFLTRGSRDGLSSNVIMQNVKVIAVDQFSDQESTRARVARTATVEVSAEDAQKLALAQQVGKISLSLRQIDEVATVEDVNPIELK